MQSSWDHAHVPPSYTQNATRRATPEVEHCYSMMNGGHELLTLTVKSGATHAACIPVMRQGHTLVGCVTVDPRADGLQVRAINLQVIGELKMQFGCQRFLSITQDLYSTEVQDSENPDSRRSAALSRGRSRLVGKHAWSYSIKLPKGVSILNGGPAQDRSSYRLPSSFEDKLGRVSVQYYLQVRIKTGILNPGHKLICPFQYSPFVRPNPPSLLRQISQLEGFAIPGPEDDPEGWSTLPAHTTTGKIFRSRAVAVTFALSLPQPLCYIRGTVVPLYLSLTSEDDQALDLLSLADGPDIRLRRMTSLAQTASSLGMVGGNGQQITESDDLASAKFSVVLSDNLRAQSSRRRLLRGELSIPGDLVPECHVLNYDMEYAIVIHQFKVVAFSPAGHPGKLLLSQRIEIATTDEVATGHGICMIAPPPYTPNDAT